MMAIFRNDVMSLKISAQRYAYVCREFQFLENEAIANYKRVICWRSWFLIGQHAVLNKWMASCGVVCRFGNRDNVGTVFRIPEVEPQFQSVELFQTCNCSSTQRCHLFEVFGSINQRGPIPVLIHRFPCLVYMVGFGRATAFGRLI